MKTKIEILTIRKLIYSLIKQQSFIIDHKIGNYNSRRHQIIQIIKSRFDMLPLTYHYHYMWLSRLRNEILTILPSSTGRFKKQRQQIIELLDEAQALFPISINEATDTGK